MMTQQPCIILVTGIMASGLQCRDPGCRRGAETVARREAARAKTGHGAWSVEALDNLLRKETLRIGLWLDSSHQTPEETVEEIWRRFRAEAVVLPQ